MNHSLSGERQDKATPVAETPENPGEKKDYEYYLKKYSKEKSQHDELKGLPQLSQVLCLHRILKELIDN